MDFALSEEQEAFQETLRRFFEERSPSADVRRSMEGELGRDPALWKQMAEELGLQGLRIPEAYGGQGFGFVELGIVFQEAGRALLCAPYFSTVGLASAVLLRAGHESQQERWLPAIAGGAQVATLVSPDPSLVARERGGRLQISGEQALVGDGAEADLLVVAARSDADGELRLAVATRDASGLEARPLETLDLTRKQAHLVFDGVDAEPLGDPGKPAEAALQRSLDEATVLLAAENLGGAERCLEMAVAYAKERVQFARPIGSFQAIQHKCAEVLLELEQARAAVRYATWVAEERPDELAAAASLAKSVSDEAYLRAAEENLHIHGGIGFTWEADPHLFLKRARTNATLLGDRVVHRARVVESLGL